MNWPVLPAAVWNKCASGSSAMPAAAIYSFRYRACGGRGLHAPCRCPVVTTYLGHVAYSPSDLLNVSRAFITLEDADFVAAIPGDLDLDGDVDFGDFLNFAQNFGKSGPVPSAIPSLILRDTVIVTVRDTVQVTRTVRDTIFLVREEAPDGPTTRARALLGYWRIDYTIASDWSDEYHLDTVTNRELDDGELIVTGRHKNGVRVTAVYSSALKKYLLANHQLCSTRTSSSKLLGTE